MILKRTSSFILYLKILTFVECESNAEQSTSVFTTDGNLGHVTIDDGSSQSTTPIKDCGLGIICIHGTCHPTIPFLCECDEHWSGPLCDKIECSPGCSCVDEDNITCSGTENYMNSTDPRNENNGLSPNTTDLSPSKIDKELDTSKRNVCESNYTNRTLRERECVPSFRCDYGVCKMNVTEMSLQMTCHCDPGAVGSMCEFRCCKFCGKYGKCDFNVTNLEDGRYHIGEEFCSCHRNYTGDTCEKLRPQEARERFNEATDHMTIMWVFLSLIAAAVIGTTAALYVMWRHRVPMMWKLVRAFQPYEGDKTYDAFVSFKAGGEDEDFVMMQLYPRLEADMGYKLCIHQRDFLVGETIANNIISAVTNSHRTILLISQRYVESDYTRFEYQVAQQSMLQQKHKILPIIMDNLSQYKQSMDPNLTMILNSVTYLQWPGSEKGKKTQLFWEKLQLSMPKRKRIDSSSPGDPNIKTVDAEIIYLNEISQQPVVYTIQC